ncbi:outer membrane protein, partial [Yoonia sp.]|uniref:outer membrane protein n=1 Tax=Yoonia sp. TaxID=2212373 RepID=UPI003F6BC69B
MANFMFSGAATLFVASVFGSAAVAQDFQQDWSGFYGGVHVDGSIYSVTKTDAQNSFLNDMPDQSLLVGHGGVTGGYNYILENNLFIGAELDYTSELAINDFFASNPQETTGVQFDLRVEGITALRGRAGFIQNNALGYLTLGVASAATNFETYQVDTGSTSLSCDTSNCAKSTEDMLGIVLGAGVDWAFREDWVARVEFQHYEFESVQAPILDSAQQGFCGGVDTDQCTVGYSPNVTSLRVGVSY